MCDLGTVLSDLSTYAFWSLTPLGESMIHRGGHSTRRIALAHPGSPNLMWEG